MNPFTKTSDTPKFSALIATAAIFFLAAVDSYGAVSVRVTAETGRGTAASVRPRALANALSQAVGSVAARHASPEEVAAKAQALKAVLAKANLYVERYSIESETVEADRYTMKLTADIDRESLLAALEGAGLKVFRLDATPRMLMIPGEGERSADAAGTIAKLFESEGFPSAVSKESVLLPGDAANLAGSKGFHVGVLVSAALPRPPEPPQGPEGAEPSPPPVPEPVPGEPVKRELECQGLLVDSRTGDKLGNALTSVSGTGADEAAALADALETCGGDLFRVLSGDLVRSGWKLGEAFENIELKITGIESPALVTELAGLFADLAEIREVSLSRIEARTAVWRARAVAAGQDWIAVLSRVKTKSGRLQWKKPPQGASGGIAVFEGQWTLR